MRKDGCEGTRKRPSAQETRECKHARESKVVRMRKDTKNNLNTRKGV